MMVRRVKARSLSCFKNRSKRPAMKLRDWQYPMFGLFKAKHDKTSRRSLMSDGS